MSDVAHTVHGEEISEAGMKGEEVEEWLYIALSVLDMICLDDFVPRSRVW